LKRNLIVDLPSREVNRYLRNGGDVMVVPIGSVEELGPHLPVGAKCLAAEAYAGLMAEAAGGLYLPVTPYGPAGGTSGRPGSIDLPDAALNEYVRAVMDDLYAQGFRRIVLVTFHHYARYYLPQEFFEDHGCAAAGVHLGEVVGGDGVALDDLVLGALRILGLDTLLARCLKLNDELVAGGKDFSIASAAAGLASGRVNVSCPVRSGEYPCPPRAGLDPAKGEEVLRRKAAESVAALEGLRAYNEYLARRGDRGFERGSWFRGPDGEEG